MTANSKLREIVENVVSRYIIGYAFEGITAKHEFQPNANPKKIVDNIIADVIENLSYRTVVPQFDAMRPRQEELAIKFCADIAGPLGKPGSPPDPVRLLEMARALYDAEVEDK